MDDSEYLALIRALESADEFVDEYSDLLRLAPVAKHVVAAYKWTRTYRIKTFIRALDAGTRRLSAREQSRFNDYINSKAGIELLAEYSETVVRSRSRTVAAALAVLYSDSEHVRFRSDFKGQAAQALEGLNDRAIDLFLLLARERPTLPKTPDDGLYPIFAIRSVVVAASPTLRTWSLNESEWVSVLNELVQRGVLAHDPSAGMRLADENQRWCCYFGFSDASEEFVHLLATARSYLLQSEQPGT